MSKTLSANYIQTILSIYRHGVVHSLSFSPDQPTVVEFGNDKRIKAGCLNCIHPHCMNLSDQDIDCAQFPGIAHDMNKTVCPVKAISMGAKSITINKEKCFGCGLCVTRCPVGAIYINRGKAEVSQVNAEDVIFLSVNEKGIHRQDNYIQSLKDAKVTGIIQSESEKIINNIYESIRKLSQEEQNILARNLLVSIGNHATLARQGNVYMRMDGFYSNDKQFGVVEIETGADMLDVTRAILDDVAVVNVRYGVKKDKNHPLSIVLSLPNKRTDYWQVLKDIKNILNMPIGTITFGALIILLWNNKEICDFDKFYIDVDNSSIRSAVTSILKRPIEIGEGFCGVLENGK